MTPTPTSQRSQARRRPLSWLIAPLISASLLLLLFCTTVPALADHDRQPALAPARNQRPDRAIDAAGVDPLPAWWSADDDGTSSVAWGDMDGDGDIDLAVGNDMDPFGYGGPNMVYLNVDGMLQITPAWQSADDDFTNDVAWGDMDGDGDLDLAVANSNAVNKVYGNENGLLTTTATWESIDTAASNSVAWGDVDGDGDLDLATGNSGPNRLYLNNDGVLEPDASWISSDGDTTASVAWGDVDGDGDLDLAVANRGSANKLYLNQSGLLSVSAGWQSADGNNSGSVSWGDVDGDGDLDLAIANADVPSKVYLNESGVLSVTASWEPVDGGNASSVAWGDVDGDGDLDLAVGNTTSPNAIYLNQGGALETTAWWHAEAGSATQDIAWGDVDGDGDLDLAAGNYETANKLYLNQGAGLKSTAAWQSATQDGTNAAAWGDIDGDGDLDLAVGNDKPLYGSDRAPVMVYLNQGTMLQQAAAWLSTNDDRTLSVAWGDMDGDGDLDLAAGKSGSSKVYLNDGTTLQNSTAWSSIDGGAQSVAWADVDGDGDLDLAAADYGRERIYFNEGGGLATAATWQSDEDDSTFDLAWGDVDDDGDLDLATANWGANKLYRNDGGVLETGAAWLSADDDWTNAVAWGDMDGDGDLDLAAGNGDFEGGVPNKVYLNDNGTLETNATWRSADNDDTYDVAWADMDGDGDLDLAAASFNGYVKIYPNLGGMLSPHAFWLSSDVGQFTSLAWGDMDGDGNPDLAAGNVNLPNKVFVNPAPPDPVHMGQALTVALGLNSSAVQTFGGSSTALAPADYLAVPAVRGQAAIPIQVRYGDPRGGDPGTVLASYSLNGGDRWQEAAGSLAQGPAGTLTFTWSVFESGFFGRSDNVVFRLKALPDVRPQPNGIAGPYQVPFVSAQTYPFRVRGTQIRVLSDTVPVSNALVYRLLAGQMAGAEPFADGAGHPYRTDSQGFLQGRGELFAGDQLVALLPISATETFTIYHTSAAPTATGLDLYAVTSSGVQTLTISSNNSLILFNLDISLEWDARNDEQFLSQLQFGLRRTAEHLFDWTDGQATLGKVMVYHDRQQWNEADVRIYATNSLRPNANQGGLVTETVTETIALAATDVMTYTPGQVRMPAIWNRYGEPGASLGEDWARTLAHELGHYALFLDDNYLGLDDEGLLIPIHSCDGTAMTDPYRDDFSEFHHLDGWIPDCEQTLSNRMTGRSDWETIVTFYPWLDGVELNTGPTALPLAVPRVHVVDPFTPTAALETPIFYVYQDGHLVQPGRAARAFLFRQEGDRLTDLGQAPLGQINARGARYGDRLCLYEPAAERMGCQTMVAGDPQLDLVATPGWPPDVAVTPITSRTVAISVTAVPGDIAALYARIFPAHDIASDLISLEATASGFTGTFNLERPVVAGTVLVWAEGDPEREIVADYALGGAPGPIIGHGGPIIGHGGPIIGHGAPALSPDGQLILYGQGLNFPSGEFFAVQAATQVPQAPPWATVVGQAYLIQASPNAPDLGEVSLSFSYLGSNVPPGQEDWLRVHFFEQVAGLCQPRPAPCWRALPTRLDTTYNVAAARCQGPGRYALMATLEIALPETGWNLFAYPLQDSRPVSQALVSASGYYATVYGYEGADPDHDPWKIFDLEATAGGHPWVNDLEQLTFNHVYWISVTEPITLLLGGTLGPETAPETVPDPPATFFGSLLPASGFQPAEGNLVTAWIGEHRCAEGRVANVNGTLVYDLNVIAANSTAPGCGLPGLPVRFTVEDTNMIPAPEWHNGRVWELALHACPDLDGDGQVTSTDIQAIAEHWDTQIGDPGWDPRFDRNQDGAINVADVMVVAAQWLNICPTP